MIKASNFLFELLTEELPPKALFQLERDLADSVQSSLIEANVGFSHIFSYSTPRRLAFVISRLAAQQPDQRVDRKGPALSAAYDTDGNPTKAALGFAQSCGIEITEVKTLKTEKGEWLFHQTVQAGKTVQELLPKIIERALAQLPIPKMMTWGKGDYEFIRPVHGLVMMYGNKPIEATLFGISASNQTAGHRFHYPKPIKVNPKNYLAQLRKAYVIADATERKAMIRQHIQNAADKCHAKAIVPEALLDEVTCLVEWPSPLVGHFEDRFLTIPKEALILSLQNNQRYFLLTNVQNDLLPYFVIISNIESKDSPQVVAGNEKVTRARLSDAEFFFNTDQKQSLASRVESLKSVIFQKELGTLFDKTQRVKKLSDFIANKLGVNTGLCARASELCKADLVTTMVGEFPELQGTMGRYYAEFDEEPNEVALALDEQYQPRFAGDDLPITGIGQVLALADRLDTLVGTFGVNKIPTGDKDPFGLRRACLGILRILIEKNLALDLKELVTQAVSFYGSQLTNSYVVEQVLEFCQERLKFWARSEGIRPDVFDAVAAKMITQPLDFKHRLDAVNHFLTFPEAINLAQANKRVSNILSKQTDDSVLLNHALLTEPAEINLATVLTAKQRELTQLNYVEALSSLAELNTIINQFFDEVMVMADDSALRANRLALLAQLRELFTRVADISLLQ